MNTGRITKSKKTSHFTVIPNAVFDDKRLSLKAMGLLCWILRLPPDWQLHKSRLHSQLSDGRDAVINAFNELEKCGYIEKTEVRDGGKFQGFNYEVSDYPQFLDTFKAAPITENPQPATPPITGKPETVKPKPEKPITENTELLKTDFTKEISKKEIETNVAPVPDAGIKKKRGRPVKEATPGGLFTEPTTPTVYTRFIEVYHEWIKKLNGAPPVMDGAAGKSAKNIIAYFRGLVEAKAKEKNEVLDPGATDNRIIETWQFLIESWPKLDAFNQNKTRLLDINSNLQNLITQIKNGKNGKQQQNQNGINGNHGGRFSDDTTAGERFASISKKFGGLEQGGN